jgi:hypothetical protein
MPRYERGVVAEPLAAGGDLVSYGLRWGGGRGVRFWPNADIRGGAKDAMLLDMRLPHLLLLMFAFLMPTGAWAHSPYQNERARLRLDDGRVLSIRAHWGDGIIGADPVMAVAVIDDGTAYGRPVAIGPISARGRIGARCASVHDCVVDYLGMGIVRA